MHLFDYLKHLIAARSLFSRKAFSSGREEKRGRAKGDYFSEIITFIAELQNYILGHFPPGWIDTQLV